MEQPRTNFFIVGAPKCGTTAFYTYLSQHPNVYMPAVKEPHYFATDLPHMRVVDRQEDYDNLFRHADKTHLAIGEASSMYLFSAVALEGIRRYAPDARIIALLRNPVDLVHSFHSQLRYGLHETEADFERAWGLQAERRHGRQLPERPTDPQLLQYKDLGSLGHQVERLLQVFPREQVQLIRFEDFIRSPRETYEATLDFLGLPRDARETFPRVNESKAHQSEALARVLIALLAAQRRVKRLLGLQASARKRFLQRFNILAKLRQANTKSLERTPLPEPFRRELAQAFDDDVRLLAELTGWDLEDWRR